jgi:glyoxylase-like metal-dependent hydrolase (beta-lactamase superfamily II)
MTDTIPFDRSHPGHYGCCITLSPLVRRVVANNPGPMTFTGTVTHLIGRGDVTVLDPGPDDPDHISALLDATAGERITRILITHTHRDHIDAVDALRAFTGAEVAGCKPDPAFANGGYRPDLILSDGDMIGGRDWTLEAVATPGHAPNHLCFALRDENALFCGDHVMAWSTTVVIPPAGSMRDYRASLLRLLSRPERVYYPAHGPSIAGGPGFVHLLLAHRERREAQILEALSGGAASAEDLVLQLYAGLSPDLRGAAALSVLAHLEELHQRGLVRQSPDGDGVRYMLA